MKKIIITILLSIAILLPLQITWAQTQPTSTGLLTDTSALTNMTETVAVTANLGNVEIGYLVAYIIKVVLGTLAAVFIVLMIMAGFRWMTAGGNEEQTKKAQGIIKTAIIGLIIVLAAYAITYFVFSALPFSGGGTLGPAV